MSRTEKDKPYRVLKAKDSWRVKVGYPAAITGAWAGVDEKSYWHSQRMKERVSLRRGEEPEPARHRHRAKWMYA